MTRPLLFAFFVLSGLPAFGQEFTLASNTIGWPEGFTCMASYRPTTDTGSLAIALSHYGLVGDDMQNDLLIQDAKGERVAFQVMSRGVNHAVVIIDGKHARAGVRVWFGNFKAAVGLPTSARENPDWKPEPTALGGTSDLLPQSFLESVLREIRQASVTDRSASIPRDYLPANPMKGFDGGSRLFAFLYKCDSPSLLRVSASMAGRLALSLNGEKPISLKLDKNSRHEIILPQTPNGPSELFLALSGGLQARFESNDEFHATHFSPVSAETLMTSVPGGLAELVRLRVGVLRQIREENKALQLLGNLLEQFKNNRLFAAELESLYRELENETHSGNWLLASGSQPRRGAFRSPELDPTLRPAGRIDTYIREPELSVFSSGRSIEGSYAFGVEEELLLNHVASPIVSGVVQLGSLVFFGTSDSKVHCLDLSSRRLLWSVPLRAPAKSDPVFSAGLVAFASENGELACIDIASGRVEWKVVLPGKLTASPALYRNLLVIGDHSGLLHGIDWTAGRLLWVSRLGAPIFGTACIDDKFAYAGTGAGSLACVQLSDGNIVWQKSFSGAIREGIALERFNRLALLAFGTSEGQLYLLNRDGDPWPTSPVSLNQPLKTPLLSNGIVYIASDTRFHQIDAFTGKSLFSFDVPAGRFRRVPVFDGSGIWAHTVIESHQRVVGGEAFRFAMGRPVPSPTVHIAGVRGEPPVLDGKITEECWKMAEDITLKHQFNAAPSPENHSVKLLWTPDYLYVAGKFFDSGASNRYRQKDEPLYLDDCFEFYFDINPDKDGWFQVDVSPEGTTFDAYSVFFGAMSKEKIQQNWRAFSTWDSKVQAKTAQMPDGKGWTLEMRIPWSATDSVHPLRPSPDKQGYLNFSYYNYNFNWPENKRALTHSTAKPSFQLANPHFPNAVLPFRFDFDK